MKLVINQLFPLFCLLGILLNPESLFAAMSSTNYRIDWDHVGVGGSDSSSSSSYQFYDSLGNASLGDSSSSTYQLNSGYREAQIEPVADFEMFIQNSASQVAASSVSSTTITVTTATGFSENDMIAIVANEGAGQVTNIGRIFGILGNDITIDEYSSGVTPTIDGSNDYVYRLDATSFSFGTLVNSRVSTGIVAWEVQADVDDGFGVYVYEDDDLKSGGLTINDVSDGAVSAGNTEYGGRSSDSSLTGSTFDTEDTAFIQSMQLVGSRGSNSVAARDFVTLKASVTGSQAAGSYSHTLHFIYVGDY